MGQNTSNLTNAALQADLSKYLKNLCFKDEKNITKADLYPCTSSAHVGDKYSGKHLIKVVAENSYSNTIALENENWKSQVKTFIDSLNTK